MKKREAVVVAVVAFAVSWYCPPRAFCDPELEVNGIMVDAKGSFALVNGEIVSEGDTIGGATVRKITSEEVVFKYHDQEFPMRVNGRFKDLPSSPQDTSVAVVATTAQGASSVEQGDDSPVSAAPMKTLYGIPREQLFPQGSSAMSEMPIMPAAGQVFDPAMAQQLMQQAGRIKAQADAKRREVERQIKEAEEGN